MSDSEKPFEATPRRIAKAKREGNVARSSELAANCSFAAAAFALVATVPLFATVTVNALRLSFHAATPGCALVVAIALVPIGCASVAGILANMATGGGLVFVALEPKFERLNPVEGLRRILSREALSHSVRAALAFMCAILAMAPALVSSAAGILRSDRLDETVARAWSAAGEVALAAGAVGLLFSIVEFASARKAWLRKLRMTFEERKRETKEEEGDALARGRRRALHRALLRGGLARVREASFVVANPTHVAVALAYRPPRIMVPEILVRALDDAALRVRELAAEYRVPIVENAPLARALYSEGRAGQPIPYAQYVAVAEVVAALMRSGAIAR